MSSPDDRRKLYDKLISSLRTSKPMSDDDSDYEPDHIELATLPTVDKSPLFSAITSNIEKFGASTPQNIRKAKVRLLSQVIDRTKPTFIAFQEVTNPKLFLQGRRNQRGLMTTPLQDAHTLQDQYEYSFGPQYVSGKGYRESYSLIYDPSVIHHMPKLYNFDPDSTPHRYRAYRGPIDFGAGYARRKRKAKIARPTSFWEMELASGPYNLRPARKTYASRQRTRRYAHRHRNLAHRKLRYEKIRFVNVHTSPSLSTIPKQLKEIMEQSYGLRSPSRSVIIGGDHYMQRRSRRMWKRLKTGQDPTWSLVAPNTDTNFPAKGRGQIADHFLVEKQRVRAHSIVALPPPTPRNLPNYGRKPSSNARLRTWTDSNIDHSPVKMEFSLNKRGS